LFDVDPTKVTEKPQTNEAAKSNPNNNILNDPEKVKELIKK